MVSCAGVNPECDHLTGAEKLQACVVGTRLEPF